MRYPGMKPIITNLVFVLVFSSVYAQDVQESEATPTPFRRWEVLLTSNMRYKYDDGRSNFDGRNGLQVGYHLSRSFIVGLESTLNESWKSYQVQTYFKLRKPITSQLFWYIHGDVGYQRYPYRSESVIWVNGERVLENVEEGTRDTWNADLTVGFEYAFADRWSGLVNFSVVNQEGLGIRYNF